MRSYFFIRLLVILAMETACVLYTDAPGICADSGKGTKTIEISAIVNEQTHAVAKAVLQEAYRRIGYHVKFDDLPGQRALEWANSGMTDGDVARIEGTERKYPNLIQVKTPVIYFQGVAFVKDIDRKIETWSDLNGLRIGIVRGIRYAEIGTKGMAPLLAHDMRHLFTLLDLARIQVAVAVLDAGKIEIHRHFRDSGIHPVGLPLYSSPLYHFVHNRNRHLVKKLDQVLAEMTRTGEIDQLWQQAIDKALLR